MGNCCEFLSKRNSSAESSSLLDDFEFEFGPQASKYSQPASCSMSANSMMLRSPAKPPPLKLTRKNTLTIYSDDKNQIKKININDFEPIKLLGKGSFGKVLLVQQKSSSLLNFTFANV